MGHYLVARYHKVYTTLPFFIPMPFNILGTLGAVIAMREPAPNRRVQFDIGVAGPLAGLIVAIPVMLIGLRLSQVGPAEQFMSQFPDQVRENSVILHEGQSLAYLGMKYLMFGQILPHDDIDVWVHPVAFAAWAGLLVTALNLIPVGQLDGGHVVFGLFGHRARALRGPIIVLLLLMAIIGTVRELSASLPPGELVGTMGDVLTALRPLADVPLPGWSGWWIWIFLIVFLLQHHAPVLDEITPLDGKRKALGIATLVIFLLIFTPTPIEIDRAAVAALLRWLI
jgi:membrane-associated protease RseP (regulator of RpoE activity)